MKKALFYLLVIFLLSAQPIFAATIRTYSVPDTNSARPNLPELYANEGKTFKREGVTITVIPNTIPYDTYLTFGIAEMVHPIRIGKYWQVSNIYEMWFRSFFNGAKVENAREDSIVVIPYSENDLQVLSFASFPEESLKMVCSPDGGKRWTMERSSSVDTSANTVSALTTVGGGCMLMSGFVPVNQYNNYRSVRGAFIEQGDEADELGRADLKEAPLGTRLSVAIQNMLGYLGSLVMSFIN